MTYNALTRQWFAAAAELAAADDAGDPGIVGVGGAEVAGAGAGEGVAIGAGERGASSGAGEWTASAEAGEVAEGTWVRFQLRLAGGRIEAARLNAFACPHTTAIAAWLAAEAPRLPLAARLPEPPRALQQRFGVPEEKLGRILVVEDAWCAAIRAAAAISGTGMV